MRRLRAVCLVSLAGLLLLSACVELESPPQACRDFADTFASKAEECGDDYQTVYNDLVNSLASGDCDNIVSIRDRDAFYDDCMPAIDALMCDQLSAANLPDSCRNQLSQ
ncbi:MAG: hypothetical protein ACQEVA_13200 [Myxococcota bacterium]